MSKDNKDRFLGLVRYAEELQETAATYERHRFYVISAITFVLVLLPLFAAWVVVIFADTDGTTNRDIGIAIVGLVPISGTLAILALQFQRLTHKRAEEEKALNRITGLLREFLPREVSSANWTVLDRAEAEIRMSRLPIGTAHDWESLREMLPVAFTKSEVPWQELVEQSSLIMLFCPDGVWKERVLGPEVEAFLKRGSKMCIMVSSEKDETLDLRNEAFLRFASIHSNVEARMFDFTPSYSCYLFDNRAVLELHSVGGEGPALVASEESKMMDFLRDEMEHMWSHSFEPSVE